jgi:cell division protein FtsX
MSTRIFQRSFSAHGFVIARWGTVFSFVSAARYMAKLFTALSTIRNKLQTRIQSHTLTTTICSNILTIICYSKFNLAVFTSFFNSNSGSKYATHKKSF